VKSGVAVGFITIIINKGGLIDGYKDISGGLMLPDSNNRTKSKAKGKA
jgi:hypothetical protein